MLTSKRLARRLAQWLPIGWRDVPFEMDPVEIELAWAVHSEQDPALNWFREHLFALAPSF
jgi:hypothetical protein